MRNKKHYHKLGNIVDKIHKYVELIEREALKVHDISCRLYEEDSQKPRKMKPKIVKKSKKKLKKSR